MKRQNPGLTEKNCDIQNLIISNYQESQSVVEQQLDQITIILGGAIMK